MRAGQAPLKYHRVSQIRYSLNCGTDIHHSGFFLAVSGCTRRPRHHTSNSHSTATNKLHMRCSRTPLLLQVRSCRIIMLVPLTFPAYHHAQMPPPPRYEPPQGASKTNPDQQYMAPLGPPPPPAAESSRSVPPSPVSPIDDRQQPVGEQYNTGQPQQFNAAQPQQEATQLPPRTEVSSRSWNPLKRFK